MYYPEITPEQIQAHADWYESIVFVDEKGKPLEPVLTDDPTPDPEGKKTHVENKILWCGSQI